MRTPKMTAGLLLAAVLGLAVTAPTPESGRHTRKSFELCAAFVCAVMYVGELANTRKLSSTFDQLFTSNNSLEKIERSLSVVQSLL